MLHGRVVAVMNAQWIGRWDVAPKGHPNDGMVDVLDGNLGLDDRLKVRSRLITGTHVPHPGIAQARVAAIQLELNAEYHPKSSAGGGESFMAEVYAAGVLARAGEGSG